MVYIDGEELLYFSHKYKCNRLLFYALISVLFSWSHIIILCFIPYLSFQTKLWECDNCIFVLSFRYSTLYCRVTYCAVWSLLKVINLKWLLLRWTRNGALGETPFKITQNHIASVNQLELKALSQFLVHFFSKLIFHFPYFCYPLLKGVLQNATYWLNIIISIKLCIIYVCIRMNKLIQSYFIGIRAEIVFNCNCNIVYYNLIKY